MLHRIQKARRRISDHVAMALQAVGIAQVAWSTWFYAQAPRVLISGLGIFILLEAAALAVIVLGEEVNDAD